MKKFFCIFLSVFMLCLVPLHGYAAAPVVWGIGEEVILPFLMALLGVQAKNEITTYQELEAYNSEIYSSLTESLAGLAGMEQIQEWIFKVVNGLIQTDSVIWQKLRELAISNYTVADSSIGSVVPSFSQIGNFNYYPTDSIAISYNNGWGSTMSGLEKATAFVLSLSSNSTGVVIGASSTNSNLPYSYTYNNKTVYYSYFGGGSSIWRLVTTPSAFEVSQSEYDAFNANRNIVAWTMIYEGSIASDNIASYSEAFSDVLTTTEKDDLVDGTTVVQLYNPATLQNGLEIIPGGDPEEDPNLKKIPFAVTADWWNFLQQFGSDTGNQVVNAYNALNGLDQGTSVGRISDAYDALGIASVGAAAAAAAEGILNLTDSNIYPQSESVADTITNTIPSSLTPEAPDSGITNESEQGLYKLPDLRDYFPFCIPFDLIDLLGKFVAEPQTPEFAIALSTGYSTSTEDVDLHVVDTIASIVRTFELVGFILALILITRNLIRG